jgi:hypothetical protein
MKLPLMEVARLPASTPFLRGDAKPDRTVGAFWEWAFSDLVSNTARGVLAEYLVAWAVGCDAGVRREWDPYDLLSPSGVKIEVKSAAYVQSWAQKDYSTPSFGIAPRGAWDAETGDFDPELRRRADVWVFALLAERDQEKVNPLDLGQWRFFVLPTAVLDEEVAVQQTIALSSLLKLDPVETGFSGLSEAVEQASARNTDGADLVPPN